MTRFVVLFLVFFSGFANLASEIIGPRMFASIMGNTNIVWAAVISVTLVGLSTGYALGGRIVRIHKVLPVILIINAFWLLLVSWTIWEVPASAIASGVRIDFSLILMTASAALFVPSVLFGMISPMAISLLARDEPPESYSRIVGNVYALGTIGSVAGALSAAFYLIPWVGLTTSLRLFAIGLILFAAYFWQSQRRILALPALLLVFIFPQPDFIWNDDGSLELLAQRDGYYQTIRVYEDTDEGYVQMFLGPTFHSKMDLETGEPTFFYAARMVDLAGAVDGLRVLVIGGAGHAMTRSLENNGATVTEVEIDPVVVELSDRHFGTVESEIVIQDGRVYAELAEANSFDLILVDAFDGAATVPPQLTTREFFQALDRILKPEGRIIYNFIGTPEGERDDAYRAMSTTIQAVFEYVGATSSQQTAVAGDESQNIIFVASPASLDDLQLTNVPDSGTILTDDRNPIDIYLQQSRSWSYFRR